MRVLVVAAHADDEVLGAGGTIARHVAAKDDVRIVICADCRTIREPGREPSLHSAAVEAALALGASPPVFLGLHGMTLAVNPMTLNREVEKCVRFVAPDVVYTHHWGDLNSDHRAVCEAVMVAARPDGRSHRVLCFEVPSSTEWAPHLAPFTPNYFVDVNDHIDRKLAAMECYREELREAPHPRSLVSLRARAVYWGQHAGLVAAEPFALAREVVR